MKGCMNMDQNKLLECMEEIKAIAQSQQNRMTKEEVHRYLSDMELKEEQFDAVYQYLVTNGITITGFHPSRTEGPVLSSTETMYSGEPEVSTETDGSQLQENADAPRRISKAERNLELYRREVSALTAHSGCRAFCSLGLLSLRRYLSKGRPCPRTARQGIPHCQNLRKARHCIG